MKRLFCLLAFSASGCTAIDLETALGSAGANSALVRMAMMVNDLEAGKHFFSYVLGFEPGIDGGMAGGWATDLLQLEDCQTVRFAILKDADAIAGKATGSAIIGLLKVRNPALTAQHRADGIRIHSVQKKN